MHTCPPLYALYSLCFATAEAAQYESVFLNEHSVECARRAAGGLIALTAAVLSGAVGAGMALIRPPGHHAEPHGAKGVCIGTPIWER